MKICYDGLRTIFRETPEPRGIDYGFLDEPDVQGID